MDHRDQELEAQVVKVAFEQKHKYDLASGMAGVLLMEAYFYHRWPSDARRRNIENAVGNLIESVSNEDMPISLWCGLVGVVYAFEFLAGVAPELISTEVTGFIDDVDDLLIQYLNNPGHARQYDLISGITGIGAYALMRTNPNAAKNLYSAVERELSRSASETDFGRLWVKADTANNLLTAPFADQPVVDLGIAHGAPGVVLLLSAGVRENLGSGAHLQALVERLKQCRLGTSAASAFGYFYPQASDAPSRVAWCYGDLSMAFCFASTADVLGDSDLRAYAQDLLARRLEQPLSSYEIHDNGLCHGNAGVLHLLRKMAGADERLASYASAIQLGLLRDRDSPGAYHCQPDLLDGMAGALLAMNDGPSRGRFHWDTCYSFGF
jgi:lantibiotic modifying enzyme